MNQNSKDTEKEEITRIISIKKCIDEGWLKTGFCDLCSISTHMENY